MEKTLSLGAFTELDEREVMETEGGIAIVPVVIIALVGSLLLSGCSGGNDGGAHGLYPDREKFSAYDG